PASRRSCPLTCWPPPLDAEEVIPGAALVRAVAGAPEDVTNRTSTVRPRRCWSAARTWGRNLLSSHSRANALGTPMRKTSSSSERTCVSLNQVSYCACESPTWSSPRAAVQSCLRFNGSPSLRSCNKCSPQPSRDYRPCHTEGKDRDSDRPTSEARELYPKEKTPRLLLC